MFGTLLYLRGSCVSRNCPSQVPNIDCVNPRSSCVSLATAFCSKRLTSLLFLAPSDGSNVHGHFAHAAAEALVGDQHASTRTSQERFKHLRVGLRSMGGSVCSSESRCALTLWSCEVAGHQVFNQTIQALQCGNPDVFGVPATDCYSWFQHETKRRPSLAT